MNGARCIVDGLGYHFGGMILREATPPCGSYVPCWIVVLDEPRMDQDGELCEFVRVPKQYVTILMN